MKTCFYSCFYRSKLRKQYKLKGGGCGDCMLHFCCETCALTQEYRELQNRGFDMMACKCGEEPRPGDGSSGGEKDEQIDDGLLF
ncbi:hypothetical protein Golob_021768 [Gossypium lobatum]|uniref:Uncharacterized protein n=1 Tax=Gossypium lobatum TaxID=34289 RepID=A0A7J8LEJ6_9ROSI|nr:hypothetical protein [Gossypium lobatum]